MSKMTFHHALFVDVDLCTGCSHCMRVCPTEAIRVRDGKARIASDTCIDCGNCYRVCPASAIQVEQDDLEKLANYSVKIALVPSVFIAQFLDEHKTEAIYSALHSLGFDVIFEVENGVEVLKEKLKQYVWAHRQTKPLISSFCPAVIRLIQVKFPSLTENIIRLKTPHDISAAYCKKYYEEQGYAPDEIGLFYVTPCAAKIAAVKSPVGEKTSLLDGVINMDFLYNLVLKTLLDGGGKYQEVEVLSPTKVGIKWSMTRGESSQMEGRALAIDGIREVSDFLEKVEMNHAGVIDFLELRACKESCASGILAPSNPFLTVERVEKRAEQRARHCTIAPNPMHSFGEFLSKQMEVEPILPRQVFHLDETVSGSLEKLERMNALIASLPGIDCGACGAPSCRALAEDMVRGAAVIGQCPFYALRQIDQEGLDASVVREIQEQVWGKRMKKKDETEQDN